MDESHRQYCNFLNIFFNSNFEFKFLKKLPPPPQPSQQPDSAQPSNPNPSAPPAVGFVNDQVPQAPSYRPGISC